MTWKLHEEAEKMNDKDIFITGFCLSKENLRKMHVYSRVLYKGEIDTAAKHVDGNDSLPFQSKQST